MVRIRSTGKKFGECMPARAGVSLIAIMAMTAAAPAWASKRSDPLPQEAAQDAPQAEAQPSDQDTQDAIVVTGRRAALHAADERKRKS